MPEELKAEHRNYAPPSLYSEGEKVQLDWLFSYFQNPITIRPNLQVRMPSFDLDDADWNAIIAALKDMEDNIESEKKAINETFFKKNFYAVWIKIPFLKQLCQIQNFKFSIQRCITEVLRVFLLP